MKAILSVFAAACAAFAAEACTVVVVGKGASATGHVIVGHNEDNGGEIAVHHAWVPPRDWPEGSVLPAEKGCAAIPQIAHTHGFFWTEMRCGDGPAQNADSFLNDCGVLIVSDNAGPTRENLADPSRLVEGGIHYNLRRCVAERASSAREAVGIMGELVERYGYVPAGRIYTVADANEAWQVQVVSGRHYVAMRCPDDAICVTPNHFTIHVVPPTPTSNCVFSADLVKYAVAKGWWPGDKPFDFARAYQDPTWVAVPHNTRRQAFVTSLLLGREWADETYPFCVKTARKVSVDDVKSALTAHPRGITPHVDDYDSPAACRKATNESLVCDFGALPAETVLHLAGQPPCLEPYRAVRPLVQPLPAAFDEGRGAARLDCHLLAESPASCATCAPGAARAMNRLPPGSVRPKGWLLRQMELQRDGLTGHAEELYEDIGKSDWLTGGSRGGEFAWERGPYYAKGLVSLAFALDDAALRARAEKWVDACLASQRANGDFGPKVRSWWANMIAIWMLRDWCEATGDARVVPFLERYFAFQRGAFAAGDSLAKDSPWAVARAGDEVDVLLWLHRKTGKAEWFAFARVVAAQTADWTSYYHKGGRGDWGPEGYRAHIVNFMQGLKMPPLKWLLGGGEADRTAFHAALAPDGWEMRLHGRPDRTLNGTEPLSGRSASEGTELCATAEHILSAQVALEILGDAAAADDLEIIAYNTLPATLSDDGKGMRYYCLLNQVECTNGDLRFRENGKGQFSIVPGPHSGFGCCRSNFHFAWPKFAESMWMRREGGLAATAYGDCIVKTPLATVEETGGYPFSDVVQLKIAETAGGNWPLFVRIPGWCREATIKLNGEVTSAAGGSFARIEREWKKGDVLELSLPSRPVVSHWKDDSLAVARGPLLYALKIATRETIVRTADSPANPDFPMKELRPSTPWNYAIAVEEPGREPKFEVKGEGLERRLAVRAVRTCYANWGGMRVDAPVRPDDPPPSPVPSAELKGAAETIELVPLALTQLRIALFPWAVPRLPE